MIIMITGVLTLIISIVILIFLIYYSQPRKAQGNKIVKITGCTDVSNIEGPSNYFCQQVITEYGVIFSDFFSDDPQNHIGETTLINERTVFPKWVWIVASFIFVAGIGLIIYGSN